MGKGFKGNQSKGQAHLTNVKKPGREANGIKASLFNS